jgi:hypothetical protein
VTVCDGIAQDHLGGTRKKFLAYSPDRLVVDAERRWAADQGLRVLHLGGGVGGREDSLFRFKAGFSNRRHRFATWRWVLRPDVYSMLCQQNDQGKSRHGKRASAPHYFPAYRAPVVDL